MLSKRRDDSWKMGNKAVDKFKTTAFFFGWTLLRDTQGTPIDYEEHWDLEYRTPKNIDIKLELKSHKDTYAGSGIPLKDYYWVEFLNVHGNTGWVDGLADYLVFEYFGKFYFYDRAKFAIAARKIAKLDTIVHNVNESTNQGYRRDKRKDLIAKISIAELHKLIQPCLIWNITLK